MKYLIGLMAALLIISCGKKEEAKVSQDNITNSLVKIITNKELANVVPADLSIFKNNGIELVKEKVDSRVVTYSASNDSAQVIVEFEKNEGFAVKHLKTIIHIKNKDMSYVSTLKDQINLSLGQYGKEFNLDNTQNYIWELNSTHNVSLTGHSSEAGTSIKMLLNNSNIDNEGV